MEEDWELETLLSLDGSSYEFGQGYIIELKVEKTDKTEQRPHGISYALVLRQKGKAPLIRFDNSHAVERPGGQYVRKSRASDHWHRSDVTVAGHTPLRPVSSCSTISSAK